MITNQAWNMSRLTKVLIVVLLFTALNIYVSKQISIDTEVQQTLNYNHWREFQDMYSVHREFKHKIFTNENMTANNNIFFLETSFRNTLTLKELCAFESAALSHPKQSLYYLMTNISIIPNEPMKQILEAYKNSKIISIDLTNVFKGSPLENLWLNNRIQRSQYYNAHMADILRLWTLYNYGGTYLDSDTITLKKLPRKFNYGGAESADPLIVANGVMHFQQGHPLLKMVIEDITLNFNGNEWGSNGPLALTKHIMSYCKGNTIEAINKDPCLFRIMKTEDFYPIYYPSWQKIFDPKQMEEVLKTVNGSYVLHYWGKLSSETDISPGTPIYEFAKEKCPIVTKYFT